MNKCDGEVSYYDRDGNQRIRVCGKDDMNYLQSQRDEASWNISHELTGTKEDIQAKVDQRFKW